MIQRAARRLGAGVASSGARMDFSRRLIWHLVLIDDTQRLAGVESLNAAHDDALKRISANSLQASGARCSLRQRRELLEIQAVAGHRTKEVGPALLQPGMQGVGIRNMLLYKGFIIRTHRNIQALIGNQSALVKRIFFGVL